MTISPTPLAPLSRRTLLHRAVLGGGGALLAALPLGAGGALAAPRLSTLAAPRFANVEALIDSYVAARKLPGMLATLGFGQAPPQVVARGLEGFTDRDSVGI
ncbi:MAG: hypothetical protein ABW194_08130, partial [Novosphingobium sp.]